MKLKENQNPTRCYLETFVYLFFSSFFRLLLNVRVNKLTWKNRVVSLAVPLGCNRSNRCIQMPLAVPSRTRQLDPHRPSTLLSTLGIFCTVLLVTHHR